MPYPSILPEQSISTNPDILYMDGKLFKDICATNPKKLYKPLVNVM